jgi:U2 small nuclear ribonucleoprotein A'
LQNYRYYLIWRCSSIRFLDFQKVKEAERTKATELFGTVDEPTELAKNIMSLRSNGRVPMVPGVNGMNKAAKTKLTEKEKRRFQALIKNAKSLPEVQKLEKAYAEGRLPAGIAAEDLMDET